MCIINELLTTYFSNKGFNPGSLFTQWLVHFNLMTKVTIFIYHCVNRYKHKLK